MLSRRNMSHYDRAWSGLPVGSPHGLGICVKPLTRLFTVSGILRGLNHKPTFYFFLKRCNLAVFLGRCLVCTRCNGVAMCGDHLACQLQLGPAIVPFLLGCISFLESLQRFGLRCEVALLLRHTALVLCITDGFAHHKLVVAINPPAELDSLIASLRLEAAWLWKLGELLDRARASGLRGARELEGGLELGLEVGLLLEQLLDLLFP